MISEFSTNTVRQETLWIGECLVFTLQGQMEGWTDRLVPYNKANANL